MTATIFLFAENQCEILENNSKELGIQEGSPPDSDLLSTNVTPSVPAACWVELMRHAPAEAPDRCPAFVSCLGKVELGVEKSQKDVPSGSVPWMHVSSALLPALFASCPLLLSISLTSFISFSFSLYSIFSFFILFIFYSTFLLVGAIVKPN